MLLLQRLAARTAAHRARAIHGDYASGEGTLMNNPAPNVLPLPPPRATAVALADRGFRVFPLKPGEKKPRFKGWWRDATRDADHPAIMCRWPSDSWPGIATGDWLLVIDPDKDKGGLEEVPKLGPFPDT